MYFVDSKSSQLMDHYSKVEAISVESTKIDILVQVKTNLT